jgi:hypothetical protein
MRKGTGMISCAVLAMAFFSPHLAAQQKTLTRQFDPVVFQIGQTALEGVAINDLHAYKYNAATDEWTPIPFQIDELDVNGRFLRETEGIVDANDEVVLMPGDAGDRAADYQWLSDAGAQQYTRFELEVNDPLAPDQKGWVYLYQKVASPPTVQGYIDYVPIPSATTGTDTIKGVSYVEGHTSNGWINYVTLSKAAGGRTPNLVDQLKVRLKGTARIPPFITLNYDATERDNLPFVGINFAKGQVRLLREWVFGIVLKSGSLTVPIDTASFVTQYFPYSIALGGDVVVDSTRTALAGISLIRISLDLSPNATGMQFRSVADPATSYPIDGLADSPASTLQDRSWLMATGAPGTLLTLVKVPNVRGTARSLYYRDDASGGTSDGTPDTGDLKSYGDMGIRFDGTVTGTLFLSFDLNFYYLDLPDQNRELAEKLNSYRQFPVELTVTEQSFKPSAVTDNGKSPRTFALLEAYPNPFALNNGSVTIAFATGTDLSLAKFRIYNVLGQEVARFEGTSLLQKQEILWNGRDRFGRSVPAGVYFYELEAGKQRAVKKLIVLR